MSFRVRRSSWVAAAVTLLVMATTAAYAVVTHGSDAAASRLVVARSHPAIAIVSTPKVQTLRTRIVGRVDARTQTHRPRLVLGTARFTVTVTNTSSVKLVDVTVADRLSPRCNRAIAALAPGASISYVCSAPNVGRDYTNTTSVSGQWRKGARVLAGARATARATIKVKPAKKKKKAHAFAPPFTG
jgi:hypothetical protein